MAKVSTIRGEAIKRWTEHYGTDCPTINTKNSNSNKKRNVVFPSGIVFLAASQSGDIDETLQLLRNGADPNSSTADGLTAHHQCCIDGNLEMLRSLVDHGADVNFQDNEGWTPLHAAASCDQSEIVSYLIEHGADVSSVNADGQIPQDLCDEDNDCLVLLQNAARDRRLDLDKARNHERQLMLDDAKQIRDHGMPASAQSLKFGATPLHVACAKGYNDVVEVLLDAGLDVNRPDDDGWTPLHAAAHWKQERACEVLADCGADFTALSNLGQTCVEVSDTDITDRLIQLRDSQPKKPTRVRKPVKILPDAPATTAEATPPSCVELPTASPATPAPIDTPATTAQTTPPSSTIKSAFDREPSAQDVPAKSEQSSSSSSKPAAASQQPSKPKVSSASQESSDQPRLHRSPSLSSQVVVPPDSSANEPETKRRQKARRSRETRRATQHVRMEDLQAAVNVGKSSTTPDLTSDEGGLVADDVGVTSDEGATHVDEAGATSDEGSGRSVNVTTPEKSEPEVSSIVESPSTAASSCLTCRCSDRLKVLETQLEQMFKTFDKDRNRVGALEKELKQVREENRALIRVIAKLSRS